MRKPREKFESFVQKENVIIDGIDISGQWNKMYEPREIMQYDLTYMDQVTDLDGGESMGWCYQCAQCTGVCPIDNVGTYGPRKIFRQLQTGLDLFNSPELWECTTCMNCLRVCPKEVDMLKIMPAVREVAVLAGNIPAELQEMFQNVAEYGNTMGESARKRTRWIKELTDDVPVRILPKDPAPVDTLWFVGDYYAYHKRGHDAAKSMARVFNRIGADFGILGADERCDGDSQRLAGEPGLFAELAEHNIEQFGKYEFNRIVVSGPHAYNAIKNEYPKFGGEYETLHYTQFLAEKIDTLKGLITGKFEKKVTFHDPCYLGRHNGEYDAQRDLITLVPGIEFVEMYRCKEQGYCCGGGGGGMWLDGFMADHVEERLSENRVKEALEVGAEVLAVCCPYEVSRFEDAVKSTGNDGKLEVLDIIEILDLVTA
ncbi:MAG: (Fe-S)-binding protein [Candidatus Marinimicrobia bacterium]|nr:(Fe-S)-binding protein [Candidatus Neomarinimicrobiota bacterium]